LASSFLASGFWPVVFGPIVFGPVVADAHEDHPRGRVAVEITRTAHLGQSLDIVADLHLTDKQGVMLYRISVLNGQVKWVQLPLDLPRASNDTSAHKRSLYFEIEFPTLVLHILTVMFDFGSQGAGPVLIIPPQTVKGTN
jgi:hypothetical protein